MPTGTSEKYDAIIIGAGISGLVCGCYLAKAGMKVLICEQHSKPGGYCTSFKRKGFIFDAAAHSFGGYRVGGAVRKTLEDLDLINTIRIKRFDPSDIIISPDYKITFWSDIERTICEFQQCFPQEAAGISKFIHFLATPNPKSFASMRSCTFDNLMDSYFNNARLKSVLAFPLFGNGGLPPSKMSAFIGAKIFKESLLDGGYYPEGGMQTFSDGLANKFMELGGTLRLSSLVKKINVKDKQATGVTLGKGEFLPSRYIVSNCDARETFFTLLGRDVIDLDFMSKIKRMSPSLSMFIIYLGMKDQFKKLLNKTVNMWYLSGYDLDKIYRNAEKGNLNGMDRHMIHFSHEYNTILAYVNAPYKNKRYWEHNKEAYLDSFMERIEKCLPVLKDSIAYKEAATPHTLFRYTLNYNGAAYGWACSPSQLASPELRKPSFVKNLYMTGHWTTQGTGIPGCIYLGSDTANLIVKKGKHNIFIM